MKYQVTQHWMTFLVMSLHGYCFPLFLLSLNILCVESILVELFGILNLKKLSFALIFFFSFVFLLVVQAISLVGAQFLEFIAAMLLLQSTANPQYKFVNFFKANKLSKERSWLLASAVGFGFLFMLVFLTSFLADRIIGHKVGITNLYAFGFSFCYNV